MYNRTKTILYRPETKILAFIEKLESETGKEFFITGSRLFSSRLFRTTSTYSDFDFFTEASEKDLEPYKELVPAFSIEEVDYTDLLTYQVLESRIDENSIPPLHIQLVTSSKLKRVAQEIIYRFNTSSLDKDRTTPRDRTAIWNKAIRLASDILDIPIPEKS